MRTHAKDVNTMAMSPAPRVPDTTQSSNRVRFLGCRLTALVALILAATIAPQAVAQVCGPNVNLAANQWIMVGVPCEPDANNNTVGDVFGPSLNAADYGSTWILYKRVYDVLVPSPGIPPNDYYTALAVTDSVAAGDAFWIWTDVGATLDFSSIGATSTAGPTFEFPAVVAESNDSPRYYLFANPYGADVLWEDLVFAGNGGRAFKTKAAIGISIVGENVHYWNGNTYFTRSINSVPEAASFVPKEAAWIEMLAGQPPLVQNLRVVVSEP
jgi:hypothetical protein